MAHAWWRTTARAGQRGITGLETAIILISFIVVASVLSFTMMNTGLFISGVAGQTALSGLERARSSIVTRGDVYATRGSVDVDGNNSIDLNGVDKQAIVKITYTVTVAVDGSPIDLTPPYTKNDTGTDPDAGGSSARTVISLLTDNVYIPSAAWTVTWIGTNDGDSMLESGEQAEITVWVHTYDNAFALWDLGTSSDPFIDTSAGLITESSQFTLQVYSGSGGASLTLQRTTPKFLDGVMNLR